MRRTLPILLSSVVSCAALVYVSTIRRPTERLDKARSTEQRADVATAAMDAGSNALQTAPTLGKVTGRGAGSSASRSLPPISPIRAAEVEWVRGQTVESLAADLGNAVILSHRRIKDPIPSLISYWHDAATRSPVALRLIEEGAAHPDEVARLLLHEASLAINEYPRARENVNNRMPQQASFSDEYYRETHRYQDPATEWKRLHVEMYGAFYVIANLGRLNESAKPTLAAFLKLPLTTSYDCLDMKVWLIDAFYHQTKLEQSAFGQRHGELTAGMTLFGPKVPRSRWNAPWDRDQLLLTATGVDVSELPTIEVYELPTKLAINKPQKMAIIDNFLKYVSAEISMK